MEAMDTKKGPVHINIPLFEPLVPELDRKHFEAGRSPYKVFKPNYVMYLAIRIEVITQVIQVT